MFSQYVSVSVNFIIIGKIIVIITIQERTVNYMAVTLASEAIHRSYGYTAPHQLLFISDVPS